VRQEEAEEAPVARCAGCALPDEMPATRKTFVVSIRDQDGPATVHEVSTGRKARLELRDLAWQIERWLEDSKPKAVDR
jgi:hypothetical protein